MRKKLILYWKNVCDITNFLLSDYVLTHKRLETHGCVLSTEGTDIKCITFDQFH